MPSVLSNRLRFGAVASPSMKRIPCTSIIHRRDNEEFATTTCLAEQYDVVDRGRQSSSSICHPFGVWAEQPVSSLLAPLNTKPLTERAHQPMQESTVKWFDAKKGYGFIYHPEDGDDVFVHYSNIETDDDFKTLKADQTVQFELNDGPKGLHALEVQPKTDTDADVKSDEESQISYEIDPSEIDPTAEVDPVPTD